MKNFLKLTSCLTVLIAIYSDPVSAGATIPPASPPPLCNDKIVDGGLGAGLSAANDDASVLYRYHTTVGPSNSVEVAAPRPYCAGRNGVVYNTLADGTFEVFATRSITQTVAPYLMCRATGQRVDCEASPTSQDVKLIYSWQLAGSLRLANSARQNNLHVSVDCLPGSGEGLIILQLSKDGWSSDRSVAMPVTCTPASGSDSATD